VQELDCLKKVRHLRKQGADALFIMFDVFTFFEALFDNWLHPPRPPHCLGGQLKGPSEAERRIGRTSGATMRDISALLCRFSFRAVYRCAFVPLKLSPRATRAPWAEWTWFCHLALPPFTRRFRHVDQQRLGIERPHLILRPNRRAP
jgi:hypothetical protein